MTARPLGSLLSDAGVVPLTPVPPSLLVGGVRVDSRTVKPGDLFFGLRGAVDDGARHARHAVANGAVAVIAESEAAADQGRFIYRNFAGGTLEAGGDHGA